MANGRSGHIPSQNALVEIPEIRYARSVGKLAVTDDASQRLVRLPLWLPDMDQSRVIEAVEGFFR